MIEVAMGEDDGDGFKLEVKDGLADKVAAIAGVDDEAQG